MTKPSKLEELVVRAQSISPPEQDRFLDSMEQVESEIKSLENQSGQQ